MIAACILVIIAVVGGTLLTVVYDRHSLIGTRTAMGACTGLALQATAGFLLSSWLGLNWKSLALSSAVLLLPSLLLFQNVYRERARASARSAAAGIVGVFRRPTAMSAACIVFYFGMALLLALVFSRNVFERAGGIYTGILNNLGDLPLHLQVISSFTQGNNFPVQDPTYAGIGFTYPLLADFFSAMLTQVGASMPAAMWIQNMVLGLALVALLHSWTTALTGNRLAGVIAPLLLIFNGGLGWWLIFQDVRNSDRGLFPLLAHLSHDYTIMSGTIFRWGNSLTTLLVPQRSMLFGLPVALCIFYLWWLAINAPEHGLWENEPAAELRPDSPAAAIAGQSEESTAGAETRRLMSAAGILAGLLPLIHTHSFIVVLGVAACLALIFRRHWRSWLLFYTLAFIVSLPEVLWLLHKSAINSQKFVGWHLGWDHGDHNIAWFWFVNTGFVVPLLLIAVFARRTGDQTPRRLLLFYAPFTLCFLVPNLIKLAPWEWDNIKIIFYWYVASIPLVAFLLARWFQQRTRWRWIALTLLLAMISAGALDLIHVISRAAEYREFSPDGISTAKLIELLATPQGIVLHAPVYDSPVYLTGRRSLLGYPGWIWSRGIDYSRREGEIREMYSGSVNAEALLLQYRIEYVLIGPQERNSLLISDTFWNRHKMASQIGEYRLYKVEREK